jgi:hypothetical protein
MARRKRGQQGGLSPSSSHDRIAPFVAPVAAHAGAVIRDTVDFDVARAVSRAFAEGVPAGGLSLADVRDRCAEVVDPLVLEERLRVYEGLGMLLPIIDKAHVCRYILNPASFAGMLALERLVSEGGVIELLHLLDSTLAAVVAGRASTETVEGALQETRLFFGLLANALGRLVATGSLAELIAEARNFDSTECLATLTTLSREVRDRFPGLDPLAYTATTEAQRYNRALEEAAARILDEGARAGDFSYLSAEDYRALAYTGTVDVLAQIYADAVFDPPSVALDVARLVAALDQYGAPRPPRPAPPEPSAPSGVDLVAAARDAERADAARRALALEARLGGADEADITNHVRSQRWPSAARDVADLLGANADPDSPVDVEMGELALVDPDMPVTYAHPVILRRRARRLASPSETPFCEALLTEDDVRQS